MVQAEKHLLSRGTDPTNLPTEAFTSPGKKTIPAANPLTIKTGAPDAAKENGPISSVPPPPSPLKKNRTRSTTNLVGLLSRPKSLKNLNKMAKDAADAEREDEEERGRGRIRGDDKKRGKSRLGFRDNRGMESQTSNSSSAVKSAAPPPASSQVTPIYAQFCTTGKAGGASNLINKPLPSVDDTALGETTNQQLPAMKPRPKSFHPVSASVGNGSTPKERPKLMTAFSSTRQMQHVGVTTPASSTPGTETPSPFEVAVNPDDIDAHLEALLDRRNIPEHQRYKMRNLASAIKMELIRQDWAEERSKRQQQASDRPQSHDSVHSISGGPDSNKAAQTPTLAQADEGSSGKSTKSKHSRVKSLTLSKVTRGRSRDRGNSDNSKRAKSPGSPLKKRAEGTLGRHLRTKSTESFVNAGGAVIGPEAVSSSSTGTSNPISGFFSKAKGPQQNSPADFVTYLRTVQAPEKVEVGKLHKLRLLLRNETVAWIEDFIGQGGMEEVVGLLHRIMAVEWSLLPALIHMIFDPEKKGPSEFTTRNIVTWVLFTYIQNASISERPARAQTVLGYLRDPERGDDEKPVSFVMDMRKDRPYRVWCKEVVSVTKEVFWIFLHHLNVIALPATAQDRKIATTDEDDFFSRHDTSATSAAIATASAPLPPKHTETASSYMLRHFPQERPPVPAAPYVGGVEWEATNYLASHLDLVNAILACTPTSAERNNLRNLMQMSGWERCMGSSLRLCKEKFYGAVHDGLRVWVAAAYEDGWSVRNVRYGPPPPPATPTSERRSNSPNKRAPMVGGPKASEPAPQLEIPKLDFVLDGEGL
ncbi:hypothetical protein SBRCBS47491_006151 [Sporothrix bragantina]|uniref:Formin GTPase-binding domain-containing protein n=1 Tax=Sporothrix bragantina TaxID=671064 RepID=A0ABP0C2Z1_9PEZI